MPGCGSGWRVAPPPSTQSSCQPLLDASAAMHQTPRQGRLHRGTWPYRTPLAVTQLQPLLNLRKSLVVWIAASGQRAGSLDNRELCETVAALGKLLLAHESGAGLSTGKQHKRGSLSYFALPALEVIQHSSLKEAQFTAVHAATAVELAAIDVPNGGLGKLTPRELSGAALALARTVTARMTATGLWGQRRRLHGAASAQLPPRPTGCLCGTP